METFAYMCFVMVAGLLGGAIGFASHFARAHFTYLPEDLGLGEPWDTLTREDYQFEKYGVGAEWDDNGFWDADSNRNLAYYVISGFAAPLVVGLMFWTQRSDIVNFTCNGLKAMSFSPMICT